MKVEEVKTWVVTGSLFPSEHRDQFEELNGFDLYVEYRGSKYVIPSFQLEQFKIEE